jgi:hypothetical protein
MVKSESLLRLAVLIDAENVSASIADRLFEEIARIGDAIVRRIYGDFSGTRLASWNAAVGRHAIQPRQQVACVPGKNSSDIALVIDAMDLLHRGDMDGFCIVSSDSDFAGLAIRMREAGVKVYGFGKHTTVEAFQHACHQFDLVETFLPPARANVVRLKPVVQKASASPAKISPAQNTKLSPAQAIALLKEAFSKTKSKDGWVNIGPLGNTLAKASPSFDTRHYGAKKLSDLVRQTNVFEVGKDSGGIRVRLRANQK